MDLGLDTEVRPGGEGFPRVSVVVPAYNEEAKLEEHLRELNDYLRSRFVNHELIVVDDGSTDETAKIAKRFSDHHDHVMVVEHVTNVGLGQAIKSGLRAATGQYVVTFDADLSYDPSHIERLVSTIHTTGARVVVASPYMEGGSVDGVPRLRAMLSRGANRLLRTLSLSKVSTVTGMVRAYDREFLQGLSLKSVDNQINAEIVYKTALLRERILEIPAELRWTRDEADTQARRGSFSIIKTTLDFLFSGFIFRPFAFFLLPGTLLGVLALYALGWSTYHFISFLPEQSGSLTNRISDAIGAAFALSPHSFVVGGIALIFAFQMISLGILSAQSKRYFEEMWFQGSWLHRRLTRPEVREKPHA